MATRMLQRRGTSAEWAALNPILAPGEIGVATDTNNVKIGNGVTPWNDLQMTYLTVAGGVMTGPLSLVAPQQPAHAARLQDLGGRVNKLGDTMSGALTMDNNQIIRPELLGYQENEITSSNDTLTVNFTAAQLHRSTRSGALQILWSNLPSSGKVRVNTIVIANSVTSVIWPVGTRFPNGEQPDISGESWLSVIARGSTVTVALSLREVL